MGENKFRLIHRRKSRRSSSHSNFLQLVCQNRVKDKRRRNSLKFRKSNSMDLIRFHKGQNTMRGPLKSKNMAKFRREQSQKNVMILKQIIESPNRRKRSSLRRSHQRGNLNHISSRKLAPFINKEKSMVLNLNGEQMVEKVKKTHAQNFVILGKYLTNKILGSSSRDRNGKKIEDQIAVSSSMREMLKENFYSKWELCLFKFLNYIF